LSRELMSDLREWTEDLLNLRRAPSQLAVFFHLLRMGRAMSVKEISDEIDLSPKATERAMARLLQKGLIQRTPFRDGAYTCDSRQVLLGLLQLTTDLHEQLAKES